MNTINQLKPKILFVNGINDNRIVKIVKINSQGGIHHVSSGTCDFYSYIDSDFIAKYLYQLDTNNQSTMQIPKGLCLIVNQISEPDSHRITLAKMASFLKQHEQIPVINHPRYIMNTRREQIFKVLQDIPGLIVPKTVRVNPKSPSDLLQTIQDFGFTFPILIRETGAHGGKTTKLLKTQEEVLNLYSFAMDGRDFYLTQYVDFAEEGVFRVARIVVVDGVPHLLHIRSSDQWMVHRVSSESYMKAHPETKTWANQQIQNFEHELKLKIQPSIAAIHQRLKLDYFGIDCYIQPDGRLLIFEVNANMLILKPFKEYLPAQLDTIEAIKKVILNMFLQRVSYES